MGINESMTGFAKTCYKILKSDRDINVGVAGLTGEGKSTFSSKFLREYSRISGTYWDFDRMTWSRKELMTWIDGEKNSAAVNGLRKGQLPEYSAILPDELFAMFYKRNWYETGQIDAIKTFNMCRDRHILLCGNVPVLWDLDGSFLNRLRFYVYIPRRGIAWVFEQENNPFSKDPWNVSENMRKFRKFNNPYKVKNFVMQIKYDDWDPDEKVRYYNIRNKKRLQAVDDNKTDKIERYNKIKKQRDITIKMMFELDKTLTNKGVAEQIGVSEECVRLARIGI